MQIRLIFAVFSIWLSSCSWAIRAELDNSQLAKQEQKIVELLYRATSALKNPSKNQAVDEAQALFELALEIKPKDERIIDGLGCVAWRKRQFKLAGYYFRKALTINPNYDRAYAHLALLAWIRGDKKAALELNSIALKLNPLNFRARNNFAALLIEDHKNFEARKELLKANQGSKTLEPEISHNLNLTRY